MPVPNPIPIAALAAPAAGCAALPLLLPPPGVPGCCWDIAPACMVLGALDTTGPVWELPLYWATIPFVGAGAAGPEARCARGCCCCCCRSGFCCTDIEAACSESAGAAAAVAAAFAAAAAAVAGPAEVGIPLLPAAARFVPGGCWMGLALDLAELDRPRCLRMSADMEGGRELAVCVYCTCCRC